MCEFISQSYTYVSWSSPLTLSLRNLRRDSLDRIEADADKGNFIRSKREGSFLRNVSLICEFISQTYNLDVRKQFANTLFVESVKWYLGALRGPWWKRKYPHLITREKLSERFLSDVCLHQHRVPPLTSWNSLLTLLSWILQRYIWELIEGYGEKGNILT